MNPQRKEARNLSEAILEEVGFRKAPVMFDRIIQWININTGFHVRIFKSGDYLRKEGLSGQLHRRDFNVWILVNENEPEYRQRFTLAHELGHFFRLLEGAYMPLSNPSDNNEERYADIFASELLMPATAVRGAWKKLIDSYNPTLTQYKLAKQFNVSNEAMGYRLNELKLQSKHWEGTKVPPVYR